MNFLLLGLRASGKTTLGPRLAAAVGWPFIDLDPLSASALRATSPAEAIAVHGIEAFRRAEAASLRVLLDRDRHVVALGGGTPTAPGVADLLTSHRAARLARLAYLRATPETLRARLEAHGPNSLADARPALTAHGTLDEIPILFQARDPLYRALASTTIDIDALTEPQALHALEQALRAPT